MKKYFSMLVVLAAFLTLVSPAFAGGKDKAKEAEHNVKAGYYDAKGDVKDAADDAADDLDDAADDAKDKVHDATH